MRSDLLEKRLPAQWWPAPTWRARAVIAMKTVNAWNTRTRTSPGGGELVGTGRGSVAPRALAAITAAGLLTTSLVALTAGPAAAATDNFRAFYQSNDHVLTEYSSTNTNYKSNLGLTPGTSPSAAELTNGTYQVAFQANNHNIGFNHFGGSTINTTKGMDAASSPTIAGLPDGTWVAAFQANTHHLFIYYPSGKVTDTGLGMQPGTNPAIAAQPDGTWTVAFAANNTYLHTYSSNGSNSNVHAGLHPGTSPAIVGLKDGSYVIAAQANTDYLLTSHISGTGQSVNVTNHGMYPGTNPAIAVRSNGTDWAVDFEANNTNLATYNNNGSASDTHAGLQPGTSPSISPFPDGSYELAGQANTTTLVTAHVSGTGQTINTTTLGMDSATAPTLGTPTPTAPIPVSNQIVAYAQAIADGDAEPGWDGGHVPYSWGGGHAGSPGPSLGTCLGYTGPSPCLANQTTGVDCSGLVRWVFDLAYGSDVLGAGNTNSQIAQTTHVTTPQPGDLVFYGSSTTNTHHVGIYIGNGEMIDALETGTVVRQDSVNVASDLLGYYRY